MDRELHPGEEAYALIMFLLFVLGFLVLAVYVVYNFGYFLLYEPMKQAQLGYTVKRLPYSQKEYVQELLEKTSGFYQNLIPELQADFLMRTLSILEYKRFILRDMDEIDKRIPILLAASFAELTFGLKHYLLSTFRTIVLYPDAYYCEIRKKYHNGEVNRKTKMIMMSVARLLEGIQDPDDGVNLAFHEFAHALSFYKMFESSDVGFRNRLERWERTARPKMQTILQGKNTFLRDYAGKNYHELLAVSVESFFERPTQFEQHMPELYQSICKLLNQDPRNGSNPILNGSRI